MSEGTGIEVRAELSIEAMQNVQIEHRWPPTARPYIGRQRSHLLASSPQRPMSTPNGVMSQGHRRHFQEPARTYRAEKGNVLEIKEVYVRRRARSLRRAPAKPSG